MGTNLVGNWSYPTTVRFGKGRISELAECCKLVGMKSPLLVTDPGIAELPMISDAIAANEAAGIPTGIFSDIQPNPVGKNVEAGVKVFRDGGYDGVIAWGGGSGVDAAKAIAFMSGQDRPIWDFDDIGGNWKRAKTVDIPSIIAVPTTSGTGSEVGRASVITDVSNHTKKIIFHPMMLPSIVICDPALVTGLPAHLTAATGMDAFVHCFEAFCAPGYHPMADGIALEGMRLIKNWLVEATHNGSNIEARAQMMSAAAMGAAAFQKGLGAVHSLAHPVGAAYGIHHGLANAVFLPYVMMRNRQAISDKMSLLAAFLELETNSFDGVLKWVLDFREQLNIPHTSQSFHIEPHKLDEFSEMATKDPTAITNAILLTSADMKKLYQASMIGDLS